MVKEAQLVCVHSSFSKRFNIVSTRKLEHYWLSPQVFTRIKGGRGGISWWERFRNDAIDTLSLFLLDIKTKQLYQAGAPVLLLNNYADLQRTRSSSTTTTDNNVSSRSLKANQFIYRPPMTMNPNVGFPSISWLCSNPRIRLRMHIFS
jgi:hypothetical protein